MYRADAGYFLSFFLEYSYAIVLAKLVRVSDGTYKKLQKAQRVRESYGDVVDRAVNALLEREQKK